MRPGVRLASAALLLTLTACPAEPRGPADRAECSADREHAAGQHTKTVASQAAERAFVLYVPRSYTGRERVPVLFNFHGFGGSAEGQMRVADFSGHADEDGFPVVAPQGQGRQRHFNLHFPGGPPALWSDGDETNDFAFVMDLLDHIVRTLCVDQARVYSTGFSNGGAMTSLLACRAADRFAAFAPVGAVVWSPACDKDRTAPVVAVNGTDDRIVPFNGGTVGCCGNPSIPAAPEMMSAWADHNGCDGPPDTDEASPGVELRRWQGCNAPTSFYVVKGGGHVWPGAFGDGTFNATDALWEFLRRHRLPARRG